MTKLTFAKGYEAAIKFGKKKITIRKGIIENIFPYSIVKTNFGFSIEIKSVLFTTFENISKQDLLDDSFRSKKEMMAQMRKFYKDIVVEDICTIIRFKKGA